MIVMLKTGQVVDIWSITAWRDHPRSRSLLTAREHRKAHAFRCPETANRWSYFHSAAREILAAYTGTPASELVFAEEEHGKPYLPADRSLYFNLSHSLSSALLAVCRFAPVGVDIEHRRALSDMDRLARRCFSTPEYTAYQAAESALREQIFFRLWTRKEAVIKASGLGLHQPLQGFDVPAIEMPSPSPAVSTKVREPAGIISSPHCKPRRLMPGRLRSNVAAVKKHRQLSCNTIATGLGISSPRGRQ